ADAITALQKSIRLAPSFAQPRWQLGNLLYAEGRYDEAFSQLRLASRSDPTLFGEMLALAWATVNGDVAALKTYVDPHDTITHLEVARFLAVQGKGADAAREIITAGEPHDEDERLLVRQTILGLL